MTVVAHHEFTETGQSPFCVACGMTADAWPHQAPPSPPKPVVTRSYGTAYLGGHQGEGASGALCPTCGVVVGDKKKHDEWHADEDYSAELTALAIQQIARALTPPRKPRPCGAPSSSGAFTCETPAGHVGDHRGFGMIWPA